MSEALVIYVHDHLAGARFAINLLHDLSKQDFDVEVARLAASLLPEIEADRTELEGFEKQIGGGASVLKEAAAWAAQKVARSKLTSDEPLGLFEAIETLSLGVLGKLALWNSLKVIRGNDDRLRTLDLEELIMRAEAQHKALESLRLKLAAAVLRQESP